MTLQTNIATAFARVVQACNVLASRVQPAGGAAGQVLTKLSATNYAAAWQTPAAGGTLAGTKTLSYTNGILTSVGGPGAAAKTLSYTNGALTGVVSVANGITVTKTLAYAAGSLATVTTAVS